MNSYNTSLISLNFTCILFSTYDILVVREVDITPRHNTGAFTSFIFYFSCILFSTYDILVVEEVDIIPGLNARASTSFNFVL